MAFKKQSRGLKAKITPLSVGLFVVLALYTIFLFALIYWGLITSFKEYKFDFFAGGNNGFGFPETFETKYYTYFFNDYLIETTRGGRTVKVQLLEMVHNSLVYAIGCSFFQTLVPCLTAYVCAKFKFKFLKIYPAIVIITMAIPIVGSTSSEIMMARNFGLYDELWGMWLMKANFLGFYFLIFYTSFKNLPNAYSEAAKIDGANNFNLLFKISLPLVKNTILTIFLIYFITFWNDYQTPMLFINDRPTIFYAIWRVFGNIGVEGDYANICATCAIAVLGLIPTTVVFILFNKKLLGNITVGGIK